MPKAKTLLSHIILLLMTLLMFFPLYTVFIMGTYDSEDIFRRLPIFPSNYLLENLKTVFQNDYMRAFLNSLLVSLGAVVLSVFTSVTVGFAIAKYEFKLQKFMLGFMMAIMMILGQISIIGYVQEMKRFGMLGTLLPLIVSWIAHPFGAFFMTQFIRDAVPDEMLESGRLDGCSEPMILARLVVPIIKPGLLTLALLVFLWSWNNFMIPLIVINRQNLFTIPLMISTLSTQFQSDYGAIMCALSLSIIPIIITFALLSKTFIEGIASGAVKG